MYHFTFIRVPVIKRKKDSVGMQRKRNWHTTFVRMYLTVAIMGNSVLIPKRIKNTTIILYCLAILLGR